VSPDRVLAEVHADAGRGDDRPPPIVKAGIHEPLPSRSAGLEIDGHQPQPLRNAEPELSETPTLPDLRTRLIDLENS